MTKEDTAKSTLNLYSLDASTAFIAVGQNATIISV